jgi:DNA-binding NarL/FixJ family response regulator
MPVTNGWARNLVTAYDVSTSLRVVLADDHAVYREGLANKLRASGIDVLAAVPNAVEAVRVVEETAADAAILDLHFVGDSGWDATRRLRRTAPATLVFAISFSATDAEIFDAIEAGASGYLDKDRPVEEMIESVRALAAGKPVIAARVATALLRSIAEQLETDADLPAEKLSLRELQVLELFAERRGIGEVSRILGLDVDAVHNQTANIFIKLRSPP